MPTPIVPAVAPQLYDVILRNTGSQPLDALYVTLMAQETRRRTRLFYQVLQDPGRVGDAGDQFKGPLVIVEYSMPARTSGALFSTSRLSDFRRRPVGQDF
jgi:hypothetical protein